MTTVAPLILLVQFGALWISNWTLARVVSGACSAVITAMCAYAAFGVDRPAGDSDIGTAVLAIQTLISAGLLTAVLLRNAQKRAERISNSSDERRGK